MFYFLSIADLVTVVDTNKRLKTAAELAFTRNFGRELFIWNDSCVRGKFYVTIWINETEFWSFPKSYRLLRCFGHLLLFAQKLLVITFDRMKHEGEDEKQNK